MMTYDCYALVPELEALPGLLDGLFEFGGGVHHDGERDVPIGSGREACEAFSRPGFVFIRFRVARVSNTCGGWLYRLEDGDAVIGLSAAVAHAEEVTRWLGARVGPACVRGEQPPPDTREEFLAWAERWSGEGR